MTVDEPTCGAGDGVDVTEEFLAIIGWSQEQLDELVSDDTEGTDPAADSCPDCGRKPGAEHMRGCDVARCLETGAQQLSCDLGHRCYADGEFDPARCAEDGCEPHDCGDDVWTGEWPGKAEAREFGWYVLPWNKERGWQQCRPDTPGARENLNRLYEGEAEWDRTARRWRLRT